VTVPIPMILRCPGCGRRHVDEGEWAARPHHTHACQHCGEVWRPAVVDTVGVRFLPGFRDPHRQGTWVERDEGYSDRAWVSKDPADYTFEVYDRLRNLPNSNNRVAHPSTQVAAARVRHPRAYEPWTREEDRALGDAARARAPVKELVRRFGRSYGAVGARLERLGLARLYWA